MRKLSLIETFQMQQPAAENDGALSSSRPVRLIPSARIQGFTHSSELAKNNHDFAIHSSSLTFRERWRAEMTLPYTAIPRRPNRVEPKQLTPATS
jgi:hypothetical protein